MRWRAWSSRSRRAGRAPDRHQFRRSDESTRRRRQPGPARAQEAPWLELMALLELCDATGQRPTAYPFCGPPRAVTQIFTERRRARRANLAGASHLDRKATFRLPLPLPPRLQWPQGAACRLTAMVLNPKSKYPSRRAYVLKMRSDANPDALVGRLENLVTGSQREFASAHELLDAIASDLEANAGERSVDARWK